MTRTETQETSTNKIDNEAILKTRYLETLSEKELRSYAIAKSHLGTSFQLEKSHGFIEWKKKNNID
uniref:Uncharacterized protein n=1 Tax=viral metagenome TaxID=1070528 RepID=A0A6C0DQZ4_9ZZZZ